jgi:hypothetical protein
LDGKQLAIELRRLGFKKPILLATSGGFDMTEIKHCFDGIVSKKVPSVEDVRLWVTQSINSPQDLQNPMSSSGDL